MKTLCRHEANACQLPNQQLYLQEALDGFLKIAHLGHDELFQVDIIRECHLAGVDAKNAALGFGVRQGKLNLAIYSAWPDESWIQGLNLVCSHDDLQGSIYQPQSVTSKLCYLRFRNKRLHGDCIACQSDEEAAGILW